MEEKVIKDLSLKISEYDHEISLFKNRWYYHMIFVLIAAILGFIGFDTIFCYGIMLIALVLFLKRINKKRKLSIQKSRLLYDLKQAIAIISMNNYLALTQKLIYAGKK